MAISLKDLKQTTSRLPSRVLLYGPHGMGKTSLSAEFPNPVFIQIEDGTPADLTLDTFGQLKSFEQVMEAVAALYGEDHGYRTLVLDSLDKFEPLLWQHTSVQNKWESIETPGYGKGYVAADSYWREFLEGCNALRRDRGMTVVLIAHSDIERFDDPQTVSYSRYDIRLHKRARAIIQDDMDAILFLNQDVTVKHEEQGFNKKRAHAEGGLSRWLNAEPRPSFNAKNRYGMPGRVIYKKGEGFKVLAPFLPGFTEPAPAAEQAAAA